MSQLRRLNRFRRNDPCPCGSSRKFKKCCGGVYDERAGEGYRPRSFLPDGRTLPGLDAMPTILRIMPASELEDFIRNSVATLMAE